MTAQGTNFLLRWFAPADTGDGFATREVQEYEIEQVPSLYIKPEAPYLSLSRPLSIPLPPSLPLSPPRVSCLYAFLTL